MKNLVGTVHSFSWALVWPKAVMLFLFLVAFAGSGVAQKLAITIDDLPQNGALPPGVT